MRPYLAIIADSFREAIASRVLVLLLIVATLFMLAVAPISLRESPAESSMLLPMTKLHLGYTPFESEVELGFVQKDALLDMVLGLFTDWVLGMFGVMVAILVTASSISQTYEAGSVDLLLSKPLSRSGVFLANFLGGCAFILLVASYVIVGLWLIAGVRHGYWNHRLMLCIPLLLFLFSIYYSVSALAGVIWKNAVVSVFVAVTFWCFCFGVRFVKWTFEVSVMTQQQLVAIVATEDSIVAVTAGRGPHRFGAQTVAWDDRTSTWLPTSNEDNPTAHGRFGPPVGRRLPLALNPHTGEVLQLAPGDPMTSGRMTSLAIYSAVTNDHGPRAVWGVVPDGVTDLLVTSKGRCLGAGSNGLFEAQRTNIGPADDKDQAAAEPSPPSIGPEDWPAYLCIAIDRQDDSLVVVTSRELIRLTANAQGRYERTGSGTLGPEAPKRLAICGSTIAVALANGKIALFDGQSLERQSDFVPFGENSVRQLASSSDGRWLAALFDHQRVWLFDVQERQQAAVDLWRQGDIAAVAFTPDDRLVIAADYNHVRTYRLDPLVADARFDPALTTPQTIYWYVVMPIYTVFPKPGELGDMVTYLVTGKRALQSPLGGNDAQPAKKLNIWQPVWTNLVFLTVLLGVACVYVERKDF